MKAHLRVARPTRDLKAVERFYREGLGFSVLASFKDHEGFDGVMLGHPDLGWHLEFTVGPHPAPRAPSEENLLVLYIPDRLLWQSAVDHMREAGFPSVPSLNPYWDRNGLTFEDPDGYRVVLENDAWR